MSDGLDITPEGSFSPVFLDSTPDEPIDEPVMEPAAPSEVILRSPDGTEWKFRVDDSGTPQVEPVVSQ